jgi:hypothetical protein
MTVRELIGVLNALSEAEKDLDVMYSSIQINQSQSVVSNVEMAAAEGFGSVILISTGA